jgi:hypothetical protein
LPEAQQPRNPRARLRATDCGGLVGEAPHRFSAIGEKVDKLDDRDLQPRGTFAFELDVDRPRPPGRRIDGPLDAGPPPAGPREPDDRLLSP